MIFPHHPSPIVRLRVMPDGPENPPHEATSTPAKRSRSRRGRPIVEATVARVRDLLETTTLSQMEIARRTGVKQATISVWLRHNRWIRPPGAPLNPAIAALWRTGPALKLSLLTGRLVAIAERMTRELEDDPGTDLERLMQAIQAVRMARVTLQGNRRRRLLVGRARTGAETMKEDAAIRAAIKDMRRGGVDWDRAPEEATRLVIEANTPAEQHDALRPPRRQGPRPSRAARKDIGYR